MSFWGSLFGQPLEKQLVAAKAEVVVCEKALQSAKDKVTGLEKKIAMQSNVPVVKANVPAAVPVQANVPAVMPVQANVLAPAPAAPSVQVNAPAAPSQPMQPTVGGKRKSRKSKKSRSRRSRSRTN